MIPKQHSTMASGALSEEQLAGYQDAFALVDKDGDGHISLQELDDVLRSLGQNLTELEIKHMLDSIDVNHDGTIEFEEFVALMIRHDSGNPDDGLFEVFEMFNKDGNGAVRISDLSKVMESLGVKLTEADLREIMKEAELDEDGKISFAEFKRLMTT